MMDKIVSGIQSSGPLTLGNYIGAIKQFERLQDKFEPYIFVANLHAITTPMAKATLKQSTTDLVAFYLASGLDAKKTTIFLQSDVLMHAQLGWILQCHTHMGELSRMIQFKDKSSKQDKERISSGLFSYPTLMAADILLYDAKYVPVGDDQKQHLELTRDLATRFNNKYGKTFVVPKPLIVKEGARIMSLSEPTQKMSKSSSSPKGCIYLLDNEKTIINKVKSATTDSIGKINYDVKKQPGISNLLVIYAQLEDLTIKESLSHFKNYN
jgi:tryptophanyl-tRNA synthetase